MDLFRKEDGVILGVGSDSFKMDRGTFKTKDKYSLKKKFKFDSTNENELLFKSNDGETLKIKFIEGGDSLTLLFDVEKKYNRISFNLNSTKDEKFYGCGEQFTSFNLKGKKVHIWVSEHQGFMKILKKVLRETIFGVRPDHKGKYKNHETYYSASFFVSSMNYSVDSDIDTYQEYDFKNTKTILTYRSIPNKITIRKAGSPIELSKKTVETLGVSSRIPDWVNDGAILATQGGSEILLKKMEKAEKAGMTIKGFWCQDWSGQYVTDFGSQVFWNWEADKNHYKDFDNLIKTLHEKGIKFLGYINTFLKEDTKLYNEAKSNGYLVKKKDGSVYLIKSTTFDAGIVDLTNPDAYNWYKEIIKVNMIDFGLDGWMADFGEYLPTDSYPFGGDAKTLHNLWPTLWAKLNDEAIKERGKEGEIFIFNRAAYKTSVPYTYSVWNGDQHVDFSDEYGLGSVIPATISMAVSGVGVAHSDTGGYTTVAHMKRSVELMKRWSELNVFTPIYRFHEGNRPEANVQFDADSVLDHLTNISKLFVSLKPYRTKVLNEYYEGHIPCNRPLFYHYDEDWCYTCQDEMMFGDSIIIAPVVREKKYKKKVHLPKGNWKMFFTDLEFTGGEYEVDAPINMPVAFFNKDSLDYELLNGISEDYKDAFK